MKVLVVCPHGHRFHCHPDHVGKRVRCPKEGCGVKFELVASGPEFGSPAAVLSDGRCEACGAGMAPAAVLCVACGVRPGRERLETIVDGADAQPPSTMNKLLYGHRVASAARAEKERKRSESSAQLAEVLRAGCVAVAAFALAFADPMVVLPRLLPDVARTGMAAIWMPLCFVVSGLSVLAAIAIIVPISEREPQRRPPFGARLRATLKAKHESREAFTLDEVLEQLAHQQRPARSWQRVAVVLLVSAAAFWLLGLLRFEPMFIVALLAALTLHELGHLAAMRLFGYRDLGMFFIPLFGAAAVGRSMQPKAWQEAIVALAGPVPSLLIGYVMIIIYLHEPQPWIGGFATMLIVLNVFNLAPLLPLDGGRVLNDVLFSRNRHLELVFRVAAALSLIAVGLLIGSWILSLLGGFMLLASWHFLKLAAATAEAAARVRPLKPGEDRSNISPERAETILQVVQQRLAFINTAEDCASMVQQVWQRLLAKPPGPLASVVLLLIYALSIASAVIVPIVIGMCMVAGSLPVPESGPWAEWFEEFRHGYEEGRGLRVPSETEG